ncbi:MAG TPA: hypothetical protein DHW02_16750 [Ktedonobacter sp.]|nr:hypothetical protein [Ktedonobacter sp.]
MDQAIWSLWHGQLFHQTICNIVSDTNCYGANGIPRFSIHFEPILFLVSLFYLVIPNPKTLQVIQVLVVASGAFPAFWLARLRLRNDWAGIPIAALYLLYPAQQWATIFDFHAVTFTAALLLYVLYFMYTRRTVLLFIFVVLAMACKEEVPVVLALYGIWSMLFQRRWRTGLAIVVLGLVWTGVGLYIVHVFSPVGHTLLAPRYGALGNTPTQVLKNILRHPLSAIRAHVLEHAHLLYIRSLFAPTAYLALLAPWVWVLMLPTLALNLFSSSQNMYSDLYQYDAEMVPVLIFASIEALVLILWIVQGIFARWRTQRIESLHEQPRRRVRVSRRRIQWVTHSGLLALLLAFILVSVVRADYDRGTMPFSKGFHWPSPNSVHNQIGESIIQMIPPNASVSAQSNLIPHVSERKYIYQFPYQDETADYIFLDVTSDISPYINSSDYINEAKSVLIHGHYGIVVAHDGYLLLKRGLPPPGLSAATAVKPGRYVSDVDVLPNLPPEFCSFIDATAQSVTNAMNVSYLNPATHQPAMSLIGYNLSTPYPFSISGNSLMLTTYWRVVEPMQTPLQVLTFMTDAQGKEYSGTNDFPAMRWCQTQTLQPGAIVQFTSRLYNVQASHLPIGLAHVSVALVPLLEQSGKMMSKAIRLPVQVVSAPTTVGIGNNAVWVTTLRAVR